MDLEDVLPTTFDLFLDWLYMQKVETNLDPDAPNATQNEQYMGFAKLWILADRLLVPRLQNEVIIAFDKVRVANNLRLEICSNIIYENTAEGSPLQQYIVQLAGSGFENKRKLLQSRFYSKDMLFDVITEVILLRIILV